MAVGTNLGLGFPLAGNGRARRGRPRLAVESLLKSTGNNWYPASGINNGWYLPGNGGLLDAAAMMAAGWDGRPRGAPRDFPTTVPGWWRWEGLRRAP